jgi:hypothetical protein
MYGGDEVSGRSRELSVSVRDAYHLAFLPQCLFSIGSDVRCHSCPRPFDNDSGELGEWPEKPQKIVRTPDVDLVSMTQPQPVDVVITGRSWTRLLMAKEIIGHRFLRRAGVQTEPAAF